MWELNLAGLNKMMKKRGLSNIIIMLLVIALSIAAIFIVYYSFGKIAKEKFGDEVSCFDVLAISPTFFIKDACYLNQGEVAVSVERKTDALNLVNIKFAFYGDNITKWQIAREKCTDARTIDTGYGGYCEILQQDSGRVYVFNVSDLEIKNKVNLVLTQLREGREISCFIDSRGIRSSC
jgi:hypothetical protein